MAVILSAPSGTGKSTICRRLLKRDGDVRYSVSCTTRRPRAGEVDGKHYFFLSRDEFQKKIKRKEFLEWAPVHEEYYGTPKRFIEDCLSRGKCALLAIDVRGAFAVRKNIPNDSVLIFVAPPSLGSLKKRLTARREGLSSLKRRLAASPSELKAAEKYDYIVVNDHLHKAVGEIESIIAAEKLKSGRQKISDIVSF
ncbi:MAG: guanylate kinase [Elusimicrobiota bacterium]